MSVEEPLGIGSGVGRRLKVDLGIGGRVVVRRTVRSIGPMVGIVVAGEIVRLAVAIVDYSKSKRAKESGVMDGVFSLYRII